MSRSLLGLVGLGMGRVVGRLTGPTPGRTVAAITGAAVAVAVVVVVTGLAIGIAETETVAGDGVNYWLVPDDSAVGSTPFAYEGTRLDGVHETAAAIAEDDRVEYATPVATAVVSFVNDRSGERAYVLAVGIVPGDTERVAGVDVSPLTEGDPHYGNGTYEGPITGELIASRAAGTQLNATAGDGLTVARESTALSFQVLEIAEEAPQTGFAEIPVVFVHLAELQATIGVTDDDRGDQVLVATENSDVAETLAGSYPGTRVETRSGLSGLAPEPTNLPFALAVAAGTAGLGVGVIFVTTMMGLELTATRRQIAVLDAIGFRRGSIALVVAVETVTIAVLAGAIGCVLGVLGIWGLNSGLAGVTALPGAARITPDLLGYGLLMALVVGLLSALYPVYSTWQTDPLEELSR